MALDSFLRFRWINLASSQAILYDFRKSILVYFPTPKIQAQGRIAFLLQ